MDFLSSLPAVRAWYALPEPVQDTLATTALAYLRQALPLTPTPAEYDAWLAGLSAPLRALAARGGREGTWDSLPVLVGYLDSPEGLALHPSWLRQSLPNLFNTTFALHQFVLESHHYSLHEYMFTHLSEDEFLTWRRISWPVSPLQ